MASASTRLFERHPLLSSIGALIIFEIVWLALLPATQGVAPAIVATGLWAAVVLIAVLWLLSSRGWAAPAGFTAPRRWRAPWLLLPLVVAAGINFSAVAGYEWRAPEAGALVRAIVEGISVAAAEESVFRGLILAILLASLLRTRNGVIGAVLVSSLLYGVSHGGALLTGGGAWQDAAQAGAYAALAGVGYAAVVLRTRSVWLVMGGHALIDIAARLPALLTDGGAALAAAPDGRDAIAGALLCLYGLFLLRDAGRLTLEFPERASAR